MTSTLKERLDSLRAELDALAAGRRGAPPLLVAVSKTVSPQAIRKAYEAGQRDFGENRVQDLLVKMEELSDLDDIRWHFIGRLQRNKIRKIAGKVALIHSIESLRLAAALDRIATEEEIASVPVLLEVNMSGEENKGGFDPDLLENGIAHELAGLSRLDIRGLMTMAPFVRDEQVITACFRGLAGLAGRLADRYGFGRELSMGMSNDFHLAVAEGATIVRIGTRIFQGCS